METSPWSVVKRVLIMGCGGMGGVGKSADVMLVELWVVSLSAFRLTRKRSGEVRSGMLVAFDDGSNSITSAKIAAL